MMLGKALGLTQGVINNGRGSFMAKDKMIV